MDSRGAALIFVLIVASLLSVLVIEFAFLMRVDNRLLHYWEDERAAFYLGKGGVEVGRKIVLVDSPLVDSLNDIWARDFPPVIVGDRAARFEIRDEDGRINVNRIVNDAGDADQQMLSIFRRLLELSGINPELADEVADLLKERAGNGAGLPGGRFRTRKELLRFPELEEVLDCLTVYSDGKININTAPADVLRSISEGIDEAMVEEIMFRRETVPFGSVGQVAALPGAGREVINDLRRMGKVNSSVFEIKVASSSGRVVKTTTAVIERARRTTVLLYFRSV